MGILKKSESSFCAGRYAAIDIGTVTSRMLVADVDEVGRLRELDRELVITNLGEDVDATGVLKREAMQRVVDAMKHFLEVLDGFITVQHPRIRPMAIATSAARDARNASEFEVLLSQLGIALSVIPGQREAALSFAGASRDFVGERLLVVDIGGGSTEVIAGLGGGEPECSHSFNIGCRRVTEKFFRCDPPDAAELESAHTWVEAGMRPFFNQLREGGFVPQRLVAVAGTATTVVSVHQRMHSYDASRVHKAVVSRSVLNAVTDQLKGVPLAQRSCIVGLEPGRAPVIVAGTVIMQVVLDLAGVDAFTVSESDILHGIVLQEAALRGPDIR